VTRLTEVLDIICHCDVTSKGLARVTGMPEKTASSRLSALYAMGVIERTPLPYFSRGRPPYLYSIKTGRKA